MKFYKKRSNLVYAGIALAAITGIAWMIGASSKAGETAVPELQTARVRTGDLVITASGAGTVIPAAQVDLGFRTSGVVTEVDMILGQQVASGDILARLDDRSEQIAFTQAEANLNALFSSSGIAEYQIELANAQSAYSTALGTLQYYISPDVYYWETRLLEAQRALAVVESEANASQAAILDAQDVVEWAGYNLQVTQAAYLNIYLPETFGAIVIDEVTLEEVIVVTPPNPIDVALARATLEQARLAVADAQAALEIIQAGDRAALAFSLTAADGTALARIKSIYLEYEIARLALADTRLLAPFDGTVVGLEAVTGQTVGTSPVVTLATMDRLLVRFYLDETDISKAAPGMLVIFTFDAYPDDIVTGEIMLVEPALQTIDGTPVVVVWASLPAETPFVVIPGLSVEAEVIAAEARDALLIPIQALRELSPGSYAVFVVSEGGQLLMTPVEIGLRDYANVEILSGLTAGDVVSTGTVETE